MVSLRKLLIKNTSWLFLSEAFSMGILFIITIIVAQALGDTAYGQLAFILAFAQIWQVFSDFGLGLVGIRRLSIAQKTSAKILSNFLSIKIIISIIIFALIILSAQFLGKPETIKKLIYIAGAYTIFYTAGEFLRSVFRAFEKFKYEAFTKISQHIILLGLIIFAVKNHSLAQIIWSYLISAVYVFIITIFIINKKFIKFSLSWDKKLISQIIKEAWPLALANLFVIIYFRVDTIMLSLMTTDEITGWYNVAYLLIFSLSFVAYAIMMSIYPKLSTLVKKSIRDFKRLYHRSLLLIIAVSFLVLLPASLAAKHLIPFFYGNEFIPAINVFYILSIAVFFAYLSNVWLYTLNALKKQKFYTWATAIGMIMNLILNFIFIPRLAQIGAAWATVITEIITGLLIFIACEYSIKIRQINN